MLEQIGRDEDQDREVPEFVSRLGGWFDRVELLERHAWQVVHNNLRQLDNDVALRDPPLRLYLDRLPLSVELLQASVIDLGQAFGVPPHLIREALATTKP